MLPPLRPALRRRQPASLYGLPLPSVAYGLASVIAVGGTGRVARMARLCPDLPGPFELDVLALDAAGSLDHIDQAGPR